MRNIIIASQNLGKLAEFNSIFEPFNVTLRPISEYSSHSPAETGTTFIENALIKARFACQASGLPSLADDSGLVVPSINGEPGIYSSRYAGDHASSDENISKLLIKLKENPNPKAYFYCVLVYLEHALSPTPIIATGIWHGRILKERLGDKGFGYDPIFYLPEYKMSAAELEPQLKNKISHRAKALNDLLKQLKSMSKGLV